MSNDSNSENKNLPRTFRIFKEKFPQIEDSHAGMAKIIEEIGPLDAKTLSLIKVGICTGAGLESATKSHVRRALENGATVEEIEQAILLAINTCGFPAAVAAWQWAKTELDPEES